jgi:hypothetical protein
MPKLKLVMIPDDKPVKVTLELLASLHRDLQAYAAILAREQGGANQGTANIDPIKLIVPMLERFIATDRAFARAKRGVQPVVTREG